MYFLYNTYPKGRSKKITWFQVINVETAQLGLLGLWEKNLSGKTPEAVFNYVSPCTGKMVMIEK